jgi:hypothetical protein
LVIVRAPTAEKHASWASEYAGRTWDLIVSTYKDSTEVADFPVVMKAGYRWPALHGILHDLGPDLGGYEYIWLIPDDVTIRLPKIDELFAVMRELRLGVAQPSLTPNSYFYWPIVVSLVNCRFRRTNFVEVMMPCFRADILRAALPMFAAARFGWGMDWVWPTLVDKDSAAGIIDAIYVHHWRPLGKELTRKESDLGETPGEEMERTLSGRHIRRKTETLEVVLNDGRRISDPVAIRTVVAQGMAALEMGVRPEYRNRIQRALSELR